MLAFITNQIPNLIGTDINGIKNNIVFSTVEVHNVNRWYQKL